MKTPTEADIYAMCMESDTAFEFAEWLREKLEQSQPVKQGEPA